MFSRFTSSSTSNSRSFGEMSTGGAGRSTPLRRPTLWRVQVRSLDTYDVWLKRGEGMTFIHFTPREDERCGLQPEVMDPGASYAISDEGVILKRD